MTQTQTLLTAGGIMLAVLLFIGGIAWLIHRYHSAPAPSPSVTQGPRGSVVQIPTRQVSVIRSSVPWLALTQYAVRGTLSIGPDGVEYTRLMRAKQVPWSEIASADVPSQRNERYLTINFTGGSGIGVITATAEGLRVALTELSRGTALTPAAHQRLGPPPQPGPPPTPGP